MSDILVKYVFPAIGAFLLACFVGYVNYRVNNRKRRDDASGVFRSTFVPALTALKELRVTEIGQVRDILLTAFPIHEAAFNEFAVHVGWFERPSLTRHWQAYRGPKPQVPELPSEDLRYRLSHFIGLTVEDEDIKRIRAIYAIEALIA